MGFGNRAPAVLHHGTAVRQDVNPLPILRHNVRRGSGKPRSHEHGSSRSSHGLPCVPPQAGSH